MSKLLAPPQICPTATKPNRTPHRSHQEGSPRVRKLCQVLASTSLESTLSAFVPRRRSNSFRASLYKLSALCTTLFELVTCRCHAMRFCAGGSVRSFSRSQRAWRKASCSSLSLSSKSLSVKEDGCVSLCFPFLLLCSSRPFCSWVSSSASTRRFLPIAAHPSAIGGLRG
eukprot:CAMPEP_0183443854 /NCGR_PEP_ID=MMETSP0370-20130417/93123_1 /TAXON_ID=268820 /ORGANISM="Peridinium aciculiferum, Strain PAER-2" /LENGTH=169 /DNA_ID=CAMNT_0025633991 /DNA_START=44 /DNA_END=553 /DNA_ORIENTATION=+